jgi:hypothetical protein
VRDRWSAPVPLGQRLSSPLPVVVRMRLNLSLSFFSHLSLSLQTQPAPSPNPLAPTPDSLLSPILALDNPSPYPAHDLNHKDIPHRASEEDTYRGYHISKGSIVVPLVRWVCGTLPSGMIRENKIYLVDLSSAARSFGPSLSSIVFHKYSPCPR